MDNNVAFVFPGQGAQYVGMGKDFYENFPSAKLIFEKASEILKLDLSQLCFNGPEKELRRTLNSQVAIFTVSIACWKVVKEQFNLSPIIVGGLSLGEYTSLVIAEAISFEEALLLVKKRAEFMEDACQEKQGGMLSIIGLPLSDVEKICEQGGGEVANLNCPGQIVISAETKNIEAIAHLVKQKKGKTIALKTGGGFHSSLMNSAAERLKKELEGTKILSAKVPIVSNFNASLEISPQEIKNNLVGQINHRTRWQDCVRLMIKKDVNTFWEIGPGKVLTKLLVRIDSLAKGYNVEDIKSLEIVKEQL